MAYQFSSFFNLPISYQTNTVLSSNLREDTSHSDRPIRGTGFRTGVTCWTQRPTAVDRREYGTAGYCSHVGETSRANGIGIIQENQYPDIVFVFLDINRSVFGIEQVFHKPAKAAGVFRPA